jgi:hypothetical protein
MLLVSGEERFTVDDLYELTNLVSQSWTDAADRDWSRPAGTLEWSCTKTADHAVDCVYSPAYRLASRRLDRYPEIAPDLGPGPEASPDQLVESLQLAARVLAAVVNDAGPDVRAIIFRRPEAIIAAPSDFVPRGAMELILHSHDVCTGLQVPFEPSPDLCSRLREHTRPWPMWTVGWNGLSITDDPWGDLLVSSGRTRQNKG